MSTWLWRLLFSPLLLFQDLLLFGLLTLIFLTSTLTFLTPPHLFKIKWTSKARFAESALDCQLPPYVACKRLVPGQDSSRLDLRDGFQAVKNLI